MEGQEGPTSLGESWTGDTDRIMGVREWGGTVCNTEERRGSWPKFPLPAPSVVPAVASDPERGNFDLASTRGVRLALIAGRQACACLFEGSPALWRSRSPRPVSQMRRPSGF